ncbi:hypothetical protein BgiBS90_037157 [Biomphalaria glabrata]|nr:hypothetical protein BgiBS90_037157 [Biomphalaria glabrata]
MYKLWTVVSNSVLLYQTLDCCIKLWTVVSNSGLLYQTLDCCIKLWTVVSNSGLLYQTLDCCIKLWTVVSNSTGPLSLVLDSYWIQLGDFPLDLTVLDSTGRLPTGLDCTGFNWATSHWT